ncbi:3-oxoacyl-ACP synthase, partial [Exiguobacterium sp. SH1S1]
MSFEVVSTGRYVPEKVVTNEDFVSKIDTTDEWIVSRTGIECRRYVENQKTADLGVLAAQKAIEKGNIPKEKIKAVIVATFTPDYLTPSVACLIQQQLQLPEDILSLDINGACSGFIYG